MLLSQEHSQPDAADLYWQGGHCGFVQGTNLFFILRPFVGLCVTLR